MSCSIQPSTYQCMRAGAEIAILSASSIILLAVVLTSAGISPQDSLWMLQWGFLAIGVSNFINIVPIALGKKPITAAVFSPIYLHLCHTTLLSGGIPLMGGMLLFSGIINLFVSTLQRTLARLFPPLLLAVALFIVGIELIFKGVEAVFILKNPLNHESSGWLSVAGLTTLLISLVGLIFKGSIFSRLSPLIGIIAGLLVALFVDINLWGDWHIGWDIPLLAIPKTIAGHLSWDRALLLPFFVTALTNAMYSSKVSVTASLSTPSLSIQTQGDVMPSAIRADAFSNMAHGWLGVMGCYAERLQYDRGSLSRWQRAIVGATAAIVLTVLSVVPLIGAAIAHLPYPIIGGYLLYLALQLGLAGLNRLSYSSLGSRERWVALISVSCGLFALYLQSAGHALSPMLEAMFHDMLIAAMIGGMCANLILRIKPSKARAGAFKVEEFPQIARMLVKDLESSLVGDSRVEDFEHDMLLLERSLDLPDQQEIGYDFWTDGRKIKISIFYTGPDPKSAPWYADQVSLNHPGSRTQLMMTYLP